MTGSPRRAVRSAGAVVVRGLIFLIQLYRHMVSPLRPASCRFVPTCSQYAVDALTEYGLFRGGWLAAVRLAKCGPWHRGGWDPIPERHELADASWADPAARGENESFV
ncbi:membrane protein insertion efficiency factor YidD [Mycobacterium intermedium]|uniref:Putative membrane protein insertion efficiency factor n=1 Tax=Mycobacterium intermedium TaxID=28445 RepID=A0A1T3W7Y6_MYCIE|nr:membrane protein insertion efficiency factor YidD [Mycobacterium intermedium]MCV6967344.1 membrane protein insertion efficiency factor YidD [Mycobacterium intermedium]OPE50475.1 membrane protein insertion efficiency factor YidD [Mycobacterium intermedium]ORB08224.1 membrane protein insertion efficiency factor YidD [Mycobacterium intermedium]